MAERSGVVSIHEVPQEEWQEGRFGGRDQDLGRAAGSVRIGLRREVISPGKQSGPRHAHMSEEELEFLSIGERKETEVIVYPDSGKLLVGGIVDEEGRRHNRVGRLREADYLDGEL